MLKKGKGKGKMKIGSCGLPVKHLTRFGDFTISTQRLDGGSIYLDICHESDTMVLYSIRLDSNGPDEPDEVIVYDPRAEEGETVWTEGEGGRER